MNTLPALRTTRRAHRLPALATLGEGARPWTPCHDLLAALLFDMFKCAAHPPIVQWSRYLRRRRPSQVELDRLWADGTGGTLSFAYVCEVLGLDPEAVRRMLDHPPILPKGTRLGFNVLTNRRQVVYTGRAMEDECD